MGSRLSLYSEARTCKFELSDGTELAFPPSTEVGSWWELKKALQQATPMKATAPTLKATHIKAKATALPLVNHLRVYACRRPLRKSSVGDIEEDPDTLPVGYSSMAGDRSVGVEGIVLRSIGEGSSREGPSIRIQGVDDFHHLFGFPPKEVLHFTVIPPSGFKPTRL